MPDTPVNIRTVDGKGRVTLGAAAAGRTVQIEEMADGFTVRFCRVIPESEAWLWENEGALKRVLQGLAEAKAGKVAEDVDLAELLAHAATIPDPEDDDGGDRH